MDDLLIQTTPDSAGNDLLIMSTPPSAGSRTEYCIEAYDVYWNNQLYAATTIQRWLRRQYLRRLTTTKTTRGSSTRRRGV